MKLDYEKWKELPEKSNLKGKKALKAVKEDAFTLRYVIEQTPEICLAAVNQDGNALRYVNNQTPEICLAAAKQTGYALQYVIEQTPEICLEAVKQDGDVLKYVEEHIFLEDKIKVTVDGKEVFISKESAKALLGV